MADILILVVKAIIKLITNNPTPIRTIPLISALGIYTSRMSFSITGVSIPNAEETVIINIIINISLP